MCMTKVLERNKHEGKNADNLDKVTNQRIFQRNHYLHINDTVGINTGLEFINRLILKTMKNFKIISS